MKRRDFVKSVALLAATPLVLNGGYTTPEKKWSDYYYHVNLPDNSRLHTMDGVPAVKCKCIEDGFVDEMCIPCYETNSDIEATCESVGLCALSERFIGVSGGHLGEKYKIIYPEFKPFLMKQFSTMKNVCVKYKNLVGVASFSSESSVTIIRNGHIIPNDIRFYQDAISIEEILFLSMSRNMCVYDADGHIGKFSPRLKSLGNVVMMRNSSNKCKITDIYTSDNISWTNVKTHRIDNITSLYHKYDGFLPKNKNKIAIGADFSDGIDADKKKFILMAY